MKKYKWGIIGPGKIAEKFAQALANVPTAELWAVASRDIARAKQFAEKYNAKHYFGKYEDIVHDEAVDIIYIATPHTFHHAHILLCLNNKKPLLCEKPMSVNYDSTQEIIMSAKRSNVFLMEAMWTRFLPVIDKLLQLINDGEIGEVKFIKADFGFPAAFNPTGRLFDLKLGGGSLLDIGVYPLFLALLLLGEPDDIKSFAHLTTTGADETMNVMLQYNNGAMASVVSTIGATSPITAEISGTKGNITIKSPWYKSDSIIVQRNGDIGKEISLPFGDNGFEFEITEAMYCLDNNLKESQRMPLSFSLMMSKIVNRICEQCNLRYNIQ